MKLYISHTEFINILKEGKFSEAQTILKEWKEAGYLQAQKDRYVSTVSINDFKVKGYVICIPNMDDANQQIKQSEQTSTEKNKKGTGDISKSNDLGSGFVPYLESDGKLPWDDV